MLEAAFKDTLFVVSEEMEVTLEDIKAALELAIETEDSKHLNVVQGLLRSAKGALEIIDFRASALLAGEMEQVVTLLVERKIKNKSQCLDAISSGIVMLPAFFKRTLESDRRENSIALLPVLQELRAARQAKPLSEDTLFLLEVKGEALADKTVQMPALKQNKDLRLLIGKYRPVFQSSLLGWIKGKDSRKHLARLAVISEKFEQAAQQERSFKLWWITGGLIEALIDNGLKSSPDLRRLLGQVDRSGKMILDEGEIYFQENTDRSLINQLLYFIGRSSSSGQRISEIRKAFSLNESLPVDERMTEAKAAMTVPDTHVMQSLSLAIREDLDKVKDALDIFNRTGSKENLQIEERFASLRKIADTLQMLGLTDLKQRVEEQHKEIASLLERNEPLTDNHLIPVAASLLQVESRLEEELENLAGMKRKEKPKYLLDALRATFRETKVNLARVKEVISQFMRDPTDIKPISRATLLLKEARAATMMAEKERLAVVLERLQDYITQHLIRSGRLPYSEHLDLLAGAIESVDFYLETLNKGRREPWYMLDNADTCLEQLLRDAPTPLLSAEDGDGSDTVSFAEEEQSQNGGTVLMSALTPEAIARMTQPVITKSAHPDAYPVMDPSMEADPEVIELFIEEAKEVHLEISSQLPVWVADNSESEALISVRRGFHTLKGSGRMVGAKRLGELAWQAENLVNRFLNGTVVHDEDGLYLLQRTVGAIPDLIEQLESGMETPEDAHQLMLALESYVEQKLHPEVEQSAEQPHLEANLDPDQKISDTQQIEVPDDLDSESDGDAPHTQIIDMRNMMKPEQPENMHTQIMDMRKVMQAGGIAGLMDSEKTESSATTPSQTSGIYHLDSPLYEIYKDESAKHLRVLREFSTDYIGKPITTSMHRAVHTLHGSANMADLVPIKNLAAELEHFIQRHYEEGLDFEQDAADEVKAVADQLETMIATINQNQVPELSVR